MVARRFVGRGIRARWADTRGMRVLGIGYPTPYLGLFREEAERCLAFMPAAQGVVKWPSARPGLAALVDEFELPLADAAVDRVLLVHALEMSHDAGGAAARGLARAGGRRAAACGGAEPARAVGAHGHDAVRPRPALFALADHAAAARDLVHADRLGRGALCAADRARLVPALGGGLGARGRDHLGAVRGRAYRRGDQAGLPRRSRRGANGAAGAGARARARAVARRVTSSMNRPISTLRGDSVVAVRGVSRRAVAAAVAAARHVGARPRDDGAAPAMQREAVALLVVVAVALCRCCACWSAGAGCCCGCCRRR